MRNSKLFLVGFGLLLVGALGITLYASKVEAGITGTDHDLSGKGWGTNQICIFCHTPHNAKTDLPAVPLWNHTTTTASFTPYSSPTLTATVGQPDGNSKACLSCHDGATAIDAFQGNSGSHFMTGAKMLGTDLSNDHPISFTYDAALATADGGLVTPASASLVVAGIPLYSAKLQCGSCHNVHDNTNDPFLRISNGGSALCLKCHNK